MEKLTAGEISPRGWLKRQLEIQAAGLAGNLDKVWPDVRDSKWIGGEREGWERVPYWLDGFIPLSFLLKDDGMVARAKRYIDRILEGQCEDGWICPCSEEERKTYDVWALFLLLKVLVLWHECSGDGRIEEAVYRALRQYRGFIRAAAPSGWAGARWYECLVSVLWLYGRRPEKWLLDLAHILKISGTDLSHAGQLWKGVEKQWTMYTHVVNAAMSLKAGPLYRRVMQKKDAPVGDADAERMYRLLRRYHGTAAGHFTGDECLSGTSPVHGTELCGVAEAMYSYEWLLALTGRSAWGDRLEALAFNALPAAVSPDMWTHQYDQQTNQIACTVQNEPSVFNTNSPDANVFGLEPNFGCCTANFGQAFPKFALSVFMREGDALVCAALAPAEVRTSVGGVPVHVTLDTLYPFRGELAFTVEAEGEFALKIRIPSCAADLAVDGRPARAEDGWFTLRRRWSGKEEVRVSLHFETKLVPRPRGLYALMRGPLLFALPLPAERRRREYVKDGVGRKYPYCDYDILPQGGWGYAFAGQKFSVKEQPFTDAFSPETPPVAVEAEVCGIDWGLEPGQKYVCRETPAHRTPLSPPEKRTFIPYGCTDLRMTELPLVRKEK